MKVLQINAVYGFLSTGIIAKDICDMLERNGEKTAVATQKTSINADNVYIVGNKLDWKYHALHSRVFGKQGYASKGATKRLLKWMDKENPDIVHLHNLHSNYINLPILMRHLSERNIPTVITLHDCWPFTGKCCHYTVDGCYKWQTGCGGCPRLKKDNKSLFLDKTAHLWNKKREMYNSVSHLAVVGVSDWITNESRKSPLFENVKNFRRIYNGFDGEVFSCCQSNLRALYGLENKKVILGVASVWLESKGLNDILKLSEMIEDNCRIVLIGYLDRDSLPANVINIPATNNQKELAEWYSTADVFITMSKEEAFGRVSAEALMCGTPIVCYDSTANSELVGENCGYVCPNGDIDQFKYLVGRILDDGKEKYHNSCIRFAQSNFDNEKCLNEYLELYREMLVL